jgi:uncharacterized protein DUF4258
MLEGPQCESDLMECFSTPPRRLCQTVEDYPDDTPYPSRLVLGWNGRRPIHVVVADNLDDNENIVITVYEPDPEEWEPDFRRRKTS